MNDLKFAFRQLLKNPGFTTEAVLALALGTGLVASRSAAAAMATDFVISTSSRGTKPRKQPPQP